MTPLQLTLQGLYSYQDKPQTIDFRHLTKAQVFGIFGATGSGKSSILEAISFSLYGKTERLTMADRRNYNMMNLKSSKLLIDFEFSSGEKEEKQYKFIVRGKRNKKRFEEVATLEREAFVKEKNEWQPIEVESAEDILGLSYENFKRTIIIPQGKFQEFLAIGATERTRMLREIFHLEKYELAPRVGSLDKKNQIAIAEKETLMHALAEATTEIEKSLVVQLKALESEATTKKTKLSAQENEIKEIDALKELISTLTLRKKEFSDLEAQSEEMKTRSKRLQQYETCLSIFQPIRIRKQEYTATLNSLHKELTSKKEVAEETHKKLTTTETTFKSIQEQFNNRESLAQKAKEIDKVSELQQLVQAEADKKERLLKGKALTDTTRLKIKNLKERVGILNTQIESEKDKLPGLKILMEVRGWLATSEQLEATAKQYQSTLNDRQEHQAFLANKKVNILLQTSIHQGQHDLPIGKLEEILQLEMKKLSDQSKKWEGEKTQLATQLQLHTLAEKLTEGEPCPLCGATHHPDALSPETVAPALQKLETSLEKTKTTYRSAQGAQLALASLADESKRLEKELAEATAAVQAHRKETDQHESSFSWEGYSRDDPATIRESLALATELETHISELEREKKGVEASLEKEGSTFETYHARIDVLNTELATVSSSLQTQIKGLQTLDFEAYRNLPGLQLDREADQLRRDYEGIEDLHTESAKHIRQLRSNLDVLKGEIDALEGQQLEQNKKLATQVKAFNERLAGSEFASEHEVEEILELALNTQAERNELTQYQQATEVAKEALIELTAKVDNTTLDIARYDSLVLLAKETRETLTRLDRETGASNQKLSHVREQLIQKKQLKKELQKLHLRADNLSTLRKLFARSGFVNYVSTIYLQNLCVAANHRFRKLTRGSLSLEATPANLFEVRDFLNNGQVRSVKTLSGGQTFQAALSLALALAEQVQQQLQSKQNFFFIDEGFGSQDKQSLQAIFEALKSLRKENRVVGIISHVEELQQEIDTYLSIENKSEEGSIVTSSWE